MSPEYREIPVDQIRLSPFNTRGEVSKEEIAALAETLKQSKGNDVPIKVRPLPNAQGIGELYEYEVVYGERRLKALKLAGIPTARCIVEDMDDTEVLMQQWMENEEHKDLSDYAKAQKLKQILDATKMNQVEVATKLGKEQNWVSRHIAMLRLEQFIPRGIIQQISEKQARAILSAPEDHLEDVTDAITAIYEARHNLPSTSEIEAITNQWKKEALPETDQAQRFTQGSTPTEHGQQEKQPPDHEHIYDAGSTHCRICGRELTAPESVKAGIGPVCASGKSRSSPEEIYATIQDLYTRFENPNAIFVVRLLQQKHGLGYEGAQQALADYKKNRLAHPPSPISTPEPTPETKETEVLEPTHSKVETTTTCPICGQLDTQQHIDEAVSDFAEYLVTAGVLPLGLAGRVKEALTLRKGIGSERPESTPVGDSASTEEKPMMQAESMKQEAHLFRGGQFTRIRYGKDLKLAAEQEVLAAESETKAQEEDEDREWEEHEVEEEQDHQSTDPEEEEP